MAAGELLPLVYEELRRMAAQKMTREPAGQTLQATALVHEAWLQLGGETQDWNSRAHFFTAAAEAMRRILIDNARRKQTKKHGSRQQRVDLAETRLVAPAVGEEMLAVHEVLDRFAELDPQKAELMKLRYFVGLTIDETAEVLGISANDDSPVCTTDTDFLVFRKEGARPLTVIAPFHP